MGYSRAALSHGVQNAMWRSATLGSPSGRGKRGTDYQRLFEAAPHPYLVLRPDADFTIVAVNDRYLEATGTVRAAVVGRPLFAVFPDDPNDDDATGVSDLRASLNRVVAEHRPDVMGVQKYDIPRRDSGEGFEIKYWSPTNSPVLDANGRLAAIIHHVEDVTEFVLLREQSQKIERVEARAHQMEAEVLRRAEEVRDANRALRQANDALTLRERELESLNSRLTELDRAKSAFFSNISHEFRTPLTLMLAPLEDHLRETGDTIRMPQADAAMIHRNASRLLRLVNGLLDFSRIEVGRLEPAFELADLATLTADLASVFRSAFEKAGVSFIVDCPPLDKPVFVDHDMWEKVVLNLLSNAFKFTLEGEVSVSLRRLGDEAVLEVRDSGVGIAQADLPRVFERFHRIEGVQGRSMEGSGIGLALVKDLVELQGGRMGVESSLGHGSLFTVSLPLVRSLDEVATPRARGADRSLGKLYAEEAERSLPRAAEAPPAPTSEAAPRPKILLVEDNADLRAYVSRVLAREFDVVVEVDGQAALERLQAGLRPALILSDVMMPRLDGVALVRAIRANSELAGIPVILLSAQAGEDATCDGLRAGADDYLVKPFTAQSLLARAYASTQLGRLRESMVDRERLLVGELNHRLKNSIATVQAVARQTLRNAKDLDQFRSDFDARLKALSTAHEILSRSLWRGADLKQVVAEQLAPYVAVEGETLTIDGDDVSLDAEVALRLSLLVHELATNAVKYGALSRPEGGVVLSWWREPSANAVLFEWRERGGPMVKPPSRKGSGMALIERLLGAGGTVDFDPAGLRLTASLPTSAGPSPDPGRRSPGLTPP
ncbi:ATP-binding protein [Caulobacter sp. UNC279MFTsu5.1]|uniref:ATP-binding protein n=1 Tax=Caulobacter sp. UNC279MFTsu5.1 TaxID=1502775 RepID=UPI0008F388BD|nr:ATP-binding protein [Caulobacter sp. UNC279MFTsu5.1]SFK70800.1 Signal transduction histidine kinase [Caulobacter sp. UNC279MFTsu5.1]